MNIPEAIHLLHPLLKGVDPDTGEFLPEDHLLQQPSMREALTIALQAMEAMVRESGSHLTRSGRLNAGRPWTPQDLADLRELYESGMSVEEIARLTHRRVRGVRLQLNLMAGGSAYRNGRIHIPDVIRDETLSAMAAAAGMRTANHGCPWTITDEETLASLFRAGQTVPQLAEVLGRSEYAVRLRLEKRHHIPPEDDPDSPTRPWSEEDVSQLRHMHESGLPIGHISAVMNRTTTSVNARLFYMGLGGSAPEIIPPDVAKPAKAAPAQSAPPPVPPAASTAVSPSRPWTAEDDAYLRQAWAEGVAIGDMCTQLGRRDRLVRYRLIYLGVTDHSLLGMPSMPPELAHQGLPWYPEDVSALYHMFRQGRTPEQMAAALLRSAGAVINRLEMLNLTTD